MDIFGHLRTLTTNGDECNHVHLRRTDGSARHPNSVEKDGDIVYSY
jgi:hypothetical protein